MVIREYPIMSFQKFRVVIYVTDTCDVLAHLLFKCVKKTTTLTADFSSSTIRTHAVEVVRPVNTANITNARVRITVVHVHFTKRS